jgi:hypothetical protein
MVKLDATLLVIQLIQIFNSDLQMNFLIKISLIIFLISITWLLDLNTALAQANSNSSSLGRELYLKNCTGCHLPIPAEVLPTESWQEILNNYQNHYGQVLPTSVKVTSGLMWTYLQVYSRPAVIGETIPQYVTDSRYLTALHPQVKLPQPTTHQTCSQCHPNATKLDYRSLSAEWSERLRRKTTELPLTSLNSGLTSDLKLIGKNGDSAIENND